MTSVCARCENDHTEGKVLLWLFGWLFVVLCLLHWRDFSMMLPVGWDEEKECVQADEVNNCSRLSVRGLCDEGTKKGRCCRDLALFWIVLSLWCFFIER